MPWLAARWISWMTSRSKVADSRSPRRAIVSGISVLPGVVDVEVVEPPRRAVAAEVGRVGVPDPGALEQRAQLGDMVLSKVLLDAVGAEALHPAAHVDVRLVDRVPERV